jgi:hypothetical protein
MGLKKTEFKAHIFVLSCSDAVLGVAKAENGCLMNIIKKCRLNIFYRKCYFPLSIPSIPIFHFSIIPCGLQKKIAAKIIIIPMSYRNSETLS